MVKVGDKVKDKVSGWEGVATCQVQTLSGMGSFDVTGTVKGGDPAVYQCDTVTLKVIEAAKNDRTPIPTGRIRLGMHVRDEAADWGGVVTAEAKYLNGCIKYLVHGVGDKFPKELWMFEQLLTPVEDKEIVIPHEPKRQGGSLSMEHR